ncbi:MAG: PQQ-binding-like beta-propeller repeat protein [Phycisphaerae bacterium]|nr:PQQ-binding-like beta-propeller repeat protein [Phycisphaerae bacterium]
MTRTPRSFPLFRTPRACRTAWLAMTVAASVLIGPGRGAADAQTPASPVFVDDSPLAYDGLIRAGELAAVGNLDEAIRVLQNLLDTEAERLLAAPGEPDLFTTVRGRVHAALMSNRPLLDRYRALEEPTAKKLLLSERLEDVERARLLTPSGYEAALRLTQRQIEAAQFHAAARTLAQLDRHPDRAGDLGRDAAELLTLAVSYQGAESSRETKERLASWRREASLPDWNGSPAVIPDIPTPRTAFASAPATNLSDLLARPLWSDEMGDRLPFDSTINPRNMNPTPREGALWLYAIPTAMGDTIYANDTHTITAWNRFTLSQKWRARIEPIQGKRYPVGQSQGFEELSGVAADATYVVALMGLAIQNTDTPRRSLMCMDARSGSVRWTRLLEDFPLSEPADSSLRGPVMIDQGIVVAMVQKDLMRRRLEGSSAIGIDARTGELRWSRPLGSSGSLAYGLRPSIIDAPTVHRGVMFVVNRLGFIAAVETTSGRVHWIRRWAGRPMTQAHADQPWESNSPLVFDDAVFAVTPDRQEIVRLDPATGLVTGRCPASKFDNPDYLVVAGGMLVGVSSTGLVAAELASFGPDSSTARCARFQAGQIRGRVLAFGDQVMVPVIEGVAVYDPKRGPEPTLRIPLDKPGNVLPLDGQLLVVDDHEIHTYLVWEVADRMLHERMDADPNNPTPAITYAELSYRAGRPEGILPAVDRALNAVERDPLSPTFAADQSRLFKAIFAMVEPPSQAAGRTVLPIDLRGALVQRLDRCASGPSERVACLLASGRYNESTDQPARAVEAYQSVLDSPELASAMFSQGETIVSADFEATRRLRRLVQTNGRALYLPYQGDADRALANLSQTIEPEPFEALARRYPVARASVTAWLEASSRYATRGKSKLAAQALEEGLATANLALDSGDPLVGELTGRLVQHLSRSGLVYPALATLEAFTRDHPNLRMTENNVTLDSGLLAAALQREIDRLDRRPRIGPEPLGAEPMLGWSVLEPVASDAPQVVTDRVLLLSDEDEIAMFKAVGPGPVIRQWGGVKDEEYVWMDSTGVTFARSIGEVEDRTDFSIIRRDLDTGQVMWQTPPFRTLVPRAPIDDLLADATREFVPLIDTPLKHRVPVIELSVLFDRRTMVLIDRMGRVAAFDLESGRHLWSSGTTVNRMHDAKLEAGTLLIGGADGPIDLDKPITDAHAADPMTGIVLSLDARTGQALHRWETTDRVRWVGLAPEGFSIVGLNDSIVSLDAYRGRERWRATARPLADSLAAWIMPGRVLVRTEGNDLFQIRSADGGVRDNALDTRDRLSGGFGTISLRALAQNAALATDLGLAVFNPSGDLIGLDTNERDSGTAFSAFGERFAVTLTPPSRNQANGQSAVSLNVFANPSLKIVSRVDIAIGSNGEPGPCALLDGKLLITSGSVTTVVDLPAGE